MHERRQNQTSHYSRQNRYFLSIGRAMEQNQILQVTSSKGKAYRVHVAPHTVGPARRSSGNACGVAFSLTSGTAVEQTDYRQTPTPPTARWLRKQEGEEMAVARTPRKLVSDGTHVGGVCRTARREC